MATDKPKKPDEHAGSRSSPPEGEHDSRRERRLPKEKERRDAHGTADRERAQRPVQAPEASRAAAPGAGPGQPSRPSAAVPTASAGGTSAPARRSTSAAPSARADASRESSTTRTQGSTTGSPSATSPAGAVGGVGGTGGGAGQGSSPSAAGGRGAESSAPTRDGARSTVAQGISGEGAAATAPGPAGASPPRGPGAQAHGQTGPSPAAASAGSASLGQQGSSTTGTGADRPAQGQAPVRGSGAPEKGHGKRSRHGSGGQKAPKQLGTSGQQGGSGTKGTPNAAGTGSAGTPGTAGSTSTPTKKLPVAAAAGTTATGSATAGTASAAKTAQTATTAGGAAKAAEAGQKAGKATKALDGAQKASRGVDGVAGNVAGMATEKVVSGKGENGARRAAGRYAGSAVSGGIAGAQAGAAAGGVGAVPGAAIGAAKGVVAEGGKDAIGAAGKITGGGPDAEPADRRELGAGGTSFERTRKGSAKGEGVGSRAGKAAAVGAAAAAAPPAGALIMFIALMKWLKTMFFQAMAAMLGVWQKLALMAWMGAKALGKGIAAPFVAVGNMAANVVGALGFGVTATVAPATAIASGLVASLTALALLGSLLYGVLTPASLFDGNGRSNNICAAGGTGGAAGPGGNGNLVEGTVPAEAIPWINNAASHSEQGIPASFFAYIMDRETDFRPDLFADDVNGGTWGLFQINRHIWSDITGGSWDSPDVKDPMVHTEYGAKYFDQRLQTVRNMRENNPNAAYTTQLTELEALMIAHNSGEGNLQKYPNIPSITQSYLEEFREKFPMYGGGEPSGAPSGGGFAGTVGSSGPSLMSLCGEEQIGGGGLVAGGMTEAQAQQLVDLYNQEGDKFLDDRYGQTGGPGSCGSNHAMNCVSFSTYFMNKYTSFQQYAPGNGIDTAGSIASMTGKQLSSVPTAYSVGSGPGSGAAGHTLVVLGVQGDQVIVGEAGYCSYMGRVRVDSKQRMMDAGWVFVDVSDLIGEGGSDPDGLIPVTPPSGPSGNAMVDAARSQIGHPYVWGGGGSNGPGAGNLSEDRGEIGYDCSGLVQYAVFQTSGRVLPRTSGAQKAAGTVIPQSQAQPGDTVWWPGHIGIYAGNGTVIHASNSSNKVVESNLWGSPTFIRY